MDLNSFQLLTKSVCTVRADFNTVQEIFEYLEPILLDPFCHLTTKQVFVMTLTKLRLNPHFRSLAYDYSESHNDFKICSYDIRGNEYLSAVCSALKIPSSEVLLRHNRVKFKEKFGSSGVFVLDC